MKTWTVTFHLKTKVPAATYEDVQAIVGDLEDDVTNTLAGLVDEKVESTVDIEEDMPATGALKTVRDAGANLSAAIGYVAPATTK